MKLTTQKTTFANTLERLKGLIENRPALPECAYVLITPASYGVRLTVTNISALMSVVMPATVIETFAPRLIAFKDLKAAIAGCKKGPVTLSQDEDDAQQRVVRVSQDERDSTIKTLPAERFPQLLPVTGDGVKTVRVTAEALKRAIRETAYAAAKVDHRPILMGVVFDVNVDNLTLAAGDGYRLAVHEMALAQPSDQTYRFIIPAVYAHQIAQAIGHYDLGDVTITYNPNTGRVQFAHEMWSVLCDTLSGGFPQFQTIRPQPVSMSVVVDSQAWRAALDEVKSAAKADGSRVMCVFACEAGQAPVLVVSAGMSGEPPMTAHPVRLTEITGSLTLHIDPVLVHETLTALGDGLVLMRVGLARTSNGLIDTPMLSALERPDSFCVIMPMTAKPAKDK